MDGLTLARICDAECKRRGISKADFYKEIGITAASFSGWRHGAKPSQKYVDAIEKFFDIRLSDFEKENTDELRETLREDLRILLHSASDLPPSSVYQLIAQIEKEKENAY